MWSQITQIWVIVTHLKLWIAVARHNFKWVKNWIIYFSAAAPIRFSRIIDMRWNLEREEDGETICIYTIIYVAYVLPSKHKRVNQCWLNVGPPSTTLAQHWLNIEAHFLSNVDFQDIWISLELWPTSHNTPESGMVMFFISKFRMDHVSDPHKSPDLHMPSIQERSNLLQSRRSVRTKDQLHFSLVNQEWRL